MHYLHTEINLFFSHFCTLYHITKMKECQQTFMNYSVFYSFRQKTPLYIVFIKILCRKNNKQKYPYVYFISQTLHIFYKQITFFLLANLIIENDFNTKKV